MKHQILLRAEGESSEALSKLFQDGIPDGFKLEQPRAGRGGFAFVDPTTLNIMIQGVTAVTASLVAAIAAVWSARLAARAKTAEQKTPALPPPQMVPALVISTNDRDIRISLEGSWDSAIGSADLPHDPREIIEIRLGVTRADAP